MSHLLVRPSTIGHDGRIHHITPQSAGWSYVGFEVIDLASGQATSRTTEGVEACLVLLSGRAAVTAGTADFGTIGGRTSPFDGAPWSVYVPAGVTWSLNAETDCELAVCSAPATGTLPPRLIRPEDVGQETRGHGTNTRYIRNILPDMADAESLLVVEAITPGGHWSSYPPHKHDTNNPLHETYLEETYYHRLSPMGGFAFQRVYTDDGSLDETMAMHDRDVVLVPRGYHPVSAPHGFDLYYLNVMAGPVRQWKFTTARGYAFLTL